MSSESQAPVVFIDPKWVTAALPAYELGPEVGSGAFGFVLEGHHRGLDRTVAIKVMRVRRGGSDTSADEARILARLDHPHIIRVHDYVQTDQLHLIVMEMMAGGTLDDRKGVLTPLGACAVGLAVAGALTCAHAKGVLHRDIKPENILFDTTGLVKVADFGIAKLMNGAAGSANTVIGSRHFMPPEQLSGGPLSPATDVYALSVVLYLLMTGQTPQAPVPPQDQPVAPELRAVPAPVRSVIQAALAADPSDRPQSAREFALALASAAAAAYGPTWLALAEVPVQLDEDVRAAAATPAATPAGPAAIRATPALQGAAAGLHRPGPGLQPPNLHPLGLSGPALPGSDPHGADFDAPGLGSAGFGVADLWAPGLPGTPVLPGPEPPSATDDRPPRPSVEEGGVEEGGPGGAGEAAAAQAAAAPPAPSGPRTPSDPAVGQRRHARPRSHRTAPPRRFLSAALFLLTIVVIAAGSLLTVVLLRDRPRSLAAPLGEPLRAHTSWVLSLAFAPSGTILASGSKDGTTRLWDVSNPAFPYPLGDPLPGTSPGVTSVAFSPDGRTLASGNWDGTVRLWDVSDPRAPASLGAPLPVDLGAGLPVDERSVSIVFLSDGNGLAAAGPSQTTLWDITDRLQPKLLGEPLPGRTRFVRLVVDDTGRTVLGRVGEQTTVRLWNVADPLNPEPLTTLPSGHVGPVNALAMSPDQRTMVTGGADTTLRLWDITDMRRPQLLEKPMRHHKSTVWSALFFPNGNTVATASYDTTVGIWDVGDRNHGRYLGPIRTGHTDWLLSMSLSPDGRTLATGSRDATIRLWDTSDLITNPPS